MCGDRCQTPPPDGNAGVKPLFTELRIIERQIWVVVFTQDGSARYNLEIDVKHLTYMCAWRSTWGGDERRLRVGSNQFQEVWIPADARYEGRACLKQLVREMQAACTAKMLMAARRADDGIRANLFPHGKFPLFDMNH
jgi:hypothetical protein